MEKVIDLFQDILSVINILYVVIVFLIFTASWILYFYIKIKQKFTYEDSSDNEIIDYIGKMAYIIDSEQYYYDENSWKNYGLLSDSSKSLKRIIKNHEIVTIVRLTENYGVCIKDSEGNKFYVPPSNIEIIKKDKLVIH
ncbi:MAG: hypothetical protein EHM58_06245 [Ignavibacteriae bacterium]|nr:MAG: hypothetical protein EHM58_06245 [Ignavibacteriota bacterium]